MAIATGKAAKKAVAAAIYAVLSADSTLTSTLACSVYGTDVPQTPGSVYLWLTLFETEDSLMGRQGRSVLVEVHVSVDGLAFRGDGRAYDILDRVLALLRWANLSITGWSLTGCSFEDDMEIEPSEVAGRKYSHHVAKYRVDVLEAA